jgi:hypothetical protein
MNRPFPPLLMLEPDAPDAFEPAPAIVDWAMSTFIMPGSTLYNPEHAHLEMATIGALWTNVPNAKHGRAIVGQAELGKPNALGKWAKARAWQQVAQWFGCVPDFIWTFDASYALNCSELEWVSLVEHEALHCAQALDSNGEPKFLKDGSAAYALRSHDVSEFVSIVRRYGAINPQIEAMIEAGSKAPEIGRIAVSEACGTCLKAA